MAQRTGRSGYQKDTALNEINVIGIKLTELNERWQKVYNSLKTVEKQKLIWVSEIFVEKLCF